MRKSFAQQLEQFSNTIDILPPELLDQIATLLERYFKDTLAADFYEILVAGHETEGGNKTLHTFRSNRKNYVVVFDGNNKDERQIAYAFLKKKPLWITGRSKEKLTSTTEYVESWSGANQLPKFWDPERIGAKTSIIFPFSDPREGILTLEFKRYIEISELAKTELLRTAQSIGIILSLYDIYQLQNRNSHSAIRVLSEELSRDRVSPLTKPKLFFGFASKADADVVGIIKGVLSEAESKGYYEVVSWDEMDESGDIMRQVREEISKATYGVCYFSEPAAPDIHSSQAYTDNANVIFEAGMLQALTNSPTLQPTAWIPIREDRSPTVPFDLAGQRIIIVERNSAGKVNEQRFTAALRKRVKAWFK